MVRIGRLRVRRFWNRLRCGSSGIAVVGGRVRLLLFFPRWVEMCSSLVGALALSGLAVPRHRVLGRRVDNRLRGDVVL